MDYIGKLIQVGENKRLVVFELDEDIDIELLEKRTENGNMNAEIRFDDMRHISAKQRKKIYALIKDITVWYGNMYAWEKETVKELLKWEFMGETGYDYFSLSNTDMTTAKEFISWLIEFCLINGVPLGEEAYLQAEDITRYVYYCLEKRICCVTGRLDDITLHHVDVIGMGGNRNKTDHSEHRVLPLNSEVHALFEHYGNQVMLAKYHLVPVKATKEQLNKWKLKWKKMDEKKKENEND